MIKHTLSLVAIAGALYAGSASAAEDFEVGVSGYINAALMGADVTNSGTGGVVTGFTDYDTTSIRTDNQINFEGATVLDNGLKVSAIAGFSLSYDSVGTNNNQNEIQQENLYIQIGGSFGDVRLGRGRNAGSLLHNFIPSAGVGTFSVDDPRMNPFVAGYYTTAASIGLAEYANRISYFTPRINGLQLAASFTPDTDPDSNPSLDGFTLNDDVNASTKNEVSLAANFAKQYNNVGVNASFGYTRANATNAAANTGAGTSLGTARALQDLEGLQAGLQLNYGKFTVGGAWGRQERPSDAGGHTHTYGAGANYQTGPWGFGASWMRRESSDFRAAFQAGSHWVQEANFYEVGGTYALGPGVTAGAGVYYNDNSDTVATRTSAAGAGAAEDSIAGVVNLSVTF